MIPVTSSLPSIGAILATPVAFAAGASSGSATFDPLNPGATVVTVGVPAGFSTPFDRRQINATVNVPNAGEIKEADVVAAAISLKARLRMVPIHTVGIHFHPYDMCRNIAQKTGGVYVDLTK